MRIVHPDRPYSNVRNLREVLRRCRDYIWWADPHFARKGFEALAEEADAAQVKEILILSGPAQTGDAAKDYKRFQAEMQNLGIGVEWRVVQTPDRKWHDRFIITKTEAWKRAAAEHDLQGRLQRVCEDKPAAVQDLVGERKASGIAAFTPPAADGSGTRLCI